MCKAIIIMTDKTDEARKAALEWLEEAGAVFDTGQPHSQMVFECAREQRAKETIRAVLQSNTPGKVCNEICERSYLKKRIAELEALQPSPNELPGLPEGWGYSIALYYPPGGHHHYIELDLSEDTPRAAAEDAIKKIRGEG